MSDPVWSPPWTSEGLAQVQVLLIGPPESGKSFAAARLAPMLVSTPDQIVVVGPPSAKVIADDLSTHYGVPVPWVKVDTVDRDAQEEVFRPLLNSPKHQLIVIDEMDTLMTAGGRSTGCPALMELTMTGRSLGKSLLGICHGTPYVAKSLVQNASLCLIFRSKEAGVLRYAKSWMCYDIDEPAELIASLPKHVALLWAPTSEPSFLGFARATQTDIDFLSPESLWKTTPDQSATFTNEGPTSPDDTAQDAASSSGTAGLPASAPRATQPGGKITSTSTAGNAGTEPT